MRIDRIGDEPAQEDVARPLDLAVTVPRRRLGLDEDPPERGGQLRIADQRAGLRRAAAAQP
jgi:hypothetical protein